MANVTRDILATPGEVFRAWTDPKNPASPWSKRNGIRLVVMKPAVGALFHINMGPPMPLATHFGRFLRLDSPRLIVHTWASEGTLGAETLVRITLKVKGKETALSLRHAGLRDAEMARGHEDGWGMILGWLADGFATPRRDPNPRCEVRARRRGPFLPMPPFIRTSVRPVIRHRLRSR